MVLGKRRKAESAMSTPTPLQKRLVLLSSISDPDKRFEALLADFERIETEKSSVESSLKTMTELAVSKITEAYPVVVQAAVDAALVETTRKIEILAEALRKYAEPTEMLDNADDSGPIVDTSAAIEALKQSGLTPS